jgi:hypothetical protein
MDYLSQQIQQDFLNGEKASQIRKTYQIGKQKLEKILYQIPNEQVTTWRYYPVAKDQIISFWQQGYRLSQITCMTGYPIILCEKVLKYNKII